MFSEINDSFENQLLFTITSNYANNVFKIIEANSLGLENEIAAIKTAQEFSFKPYNKSIEKIPSKYKGLLEECLPHYNYLYSFKK